MWVLLNNMDQNSVHLQQYITTDSEWAYQIFVDENNLIKNMNACVEPKSSQAKQLLVKKETFKKIMLF